MKSQATGTIKFEKNAEKAMQCLLWILKKCPGISKYNIMKVMFAADCYHLNTYGRPIYGESYVAMKYGAVPSFMKDLLSMRSGMPFVECDKNAFKATADPDWEQLSESDTEALQKGLEEYGSLSFAEVKKKNHQHRAWKNHKEELKTVRFCPISYEEMIDNPEVLADLQELGDLTQSMVF